MSLERQTRLGRTDNSFYIESQPPLDYHETFDNTDLGIIAHSCIDIPSHNSRVQVYRKNNFGITKDDRETEFVNHISVTAAFFGNIALSPGIIDIERGVISLFDAEIAQTAQ